MLRVFCFALGRGGEEGTVEDSPFRLRILTLDLIYRHDVDVRLPVAKFGLYR